MPLKPAYDPTDPRYYDEKDLRSEVERILGLCSVCRMCVKFCGSFPTMFDAVDDYCTEGKYAEVDTKKFKSEDLPQVVDLCFQCKLCYIKCPYMPGDHDWAIDFPRLIARAKAQEVKKNGIPLTDKLLGRPDLVGNWELQRHRCRTGAMTTVSTASSCIAFKEMAEGNPKVTCSDCPLAAIQIEQVTAAGRSIPCKFSREAIAARRSVDPIFDLR